MVLRRKKAPSPVKYLVSCHILQGSSLTSSQLTGWNSHFDDRQYHVLNSLTGSILVFHSSVIFAPSQIRSAKQGIMLSTFCRHCDNIPRVPRNGYTD